MVWNYSNTSVETTLSSGINAVAVSMTVASVSGFPVSYPYTLVVDFGESNCEVVNVTAGVGTLLTIERGKDGTSAGGHSSGAVVSHAVVARDLAEPQAHIAASTAVHGLAGGVSVVGTTTSQTLTNKTIDGGANTLTNIATSSLVGSIAASSLTGTFGVVDITAPLNDEGLTVTDVGGGARLNHLAKFGPNVKVTDNGDIQMGGSHFTTETKAVGAGALTQRIYSKNGTSLPALVLDRATANTDDLLQLKANAVTIGNVDKDAKVSVRGIIANQIAADTTTKLYDAKNSGASSVFSVNYQGNVLASGTLGVTGAATLSAGAAVTGAITATTTISANGIDLNKRPYARLRQTSAQTITTATDTAVLFNAEDLDSHNGHSTVSNTSRYTIQTGYDGIYAVQGTYASAASATGARICSIRKNGTTVNGSSGWDLVPSASFGSVCPGRRVLVSCVAGDYLELYAFHQHGSNLDTAVTASDQSTMTVEYIGTT